MSLANDVTVLRADPSVSGSGRQGAGTASAPRVLKQRFVLDEKLGSGGMGTVFRAKDLRKVEARDRNPYVAVKVLNNDFREHPEAFIALQREAAKSQGLSHRNIVSIYDFDKDGDVPFIIMELLEGEELAALLRAYPTGMPDEMAWKIIRCLCDGLEHAHEAGLVHADFKPGNVFVAPSTTAKILDFGIARAVNLNLAGEVVDDGPRSPAALTPAYASAEMLDREDPEPRDDLFSLGVVIYLMLTGTHPFGRVPANEARDQGLQPERPRRLSRRQWRTLSRCLAFRRKDRPASVDEVRQGLFQPSPWRSRTVLIAALAVLITLAASALKEEAAVQEATVTVRQATLVDAQVARVEALLGSGRAEPAWEAAVAEEVAVLRALLPVGAPEPEVLARVRARYEALILAEPDRDAAIALLGRGRAFGPLPQADVHLREQLTADVERLLDAPSLTTDWMMALESALSRLTEVYPDAPTLSVLRLETVNVMGALLEADLTVERFPAARHALRLLEAHGFDAQLLEDMHERVAGAERQYQSRQVAQARDDARQRFFAELDGALEGACLRFEPEPAATVYRRWVGRYPVFADAGRDRVGTHVARCAAQVEAVDRQRATDLRRRSVAAFGPLPGVSGGREDPCAADYLLGSGSQIGRGASCADRVGAAGQGPRLVVVGGAAPGERFAITRQEVSWAELAAFCASVGDCPPAAAGELPVTGVPLALAQHFARWLSEQTGFVYRLPSYEQWRLAARGTEDPNRNCQVRLGSVRRGLAPVAAGVGAANPQGLLNVLGNVQEWVLDDGVVKVAGGAYADDLAECSVDALRSHSGGADAMTGFRLVREVS